MLIDLDISYIFPIIIFYTVRSVEESVVIIHGVIVFLPRFSVFASQNNNLPFLSADGREMRYVNQDRSESNLFPRTD